MASPADFIAVCDSADLPPGSQRLVQLGHASVLLCRSGDALHAVQSLCPHAWQSLAGGPVRDGVIQCPKHGARFDLRTGRPVNGVTATGLNVYPVREEAGRVLLSLPVAR